MAGSLSPINEFGYFVKRESLLVTSKLVAVPAAEVIAPMVALGGAASGAVLGLLTTGVAVAIATGLSQMDYVHKRDVLKDLYKEELAAQLGKSKDKVTASDLDEVAKHNKVLAEELSRTRKQRNWGIGVAFIATMAAIAFVSFVIAGPAVGAMLASFGLVEGGGFLASAALLAVHAITGYAAYKAVEIPVEKVADKFFGIHKKIANDHIVEMERDRESGKVISREQVLSLFVAANPELDRMIVTNFGKHFDELSVPNKQRATEQINQIIPLEKLTLDINMGINRPSELAFAVEGKHSGAHHSPEEAQEERRGGLRGMLDDVGVKLEQTKVGRKVEGIATAVMANTTPFIDQPAIAPRSEASKSFVERLGRGKRSQAGSFAERVEQSRADPSVSLQRS